MRFFQSVIAILLNKKLLTSFDALNDCHDNIPSSTKSSKTLNLNSKRYYMFGEIDEGSSTTQLLSSGSFAIFSKAVNYLIRKLPTRWLSMTRFETEFIFSWHMNVMKYIEITRNPHFQIFWKKMRGNY